VILGLKKQKLPATLAYLSNIQNYLFINKKKQQQKITIRSKILPLIKKMDLSHPT